MAAATAMGGAWSWSVVLLGVIAAATANLAALLVNDLADDSADNANTRYVAGFSGGTRALQDGLLEKREMVIGAVALTATAAVAAILLSRIAGPQVLLFGAVAVVGGVIYSAGPRLVSRGFGEVVLGLCAGLAPVLGGWVAITGGISSEAWVIGGAQALSIAAVCFALHGLDAVTDAAAGKRTLAARVSRDRLPSAVAAIHVPAVVAIAVALVMTGVPAFASVALVGVAILVTLQLAAHDSANRLRLAAWVCITYQCGSVALACVALWHSTDGRWLVPIAVALGGVAMVQAMAPLLKPRDGTAGTRAALAVDTVTTHRTPWPRGE